MSPLEIVLYSLLGAVCLGLLFKWIVYDKYIKPKRKPKEKKEKTKKYEDEE